MKKYRRSLFIFRRDLRLQDNIGLIDALDNSDEVIASFIFTTEQLETNPYRSDRCLQFMLESLEDLEKQLETQSGRLFLFYGNPHEIVKQCHAEVNFQAVFANRDYTPYSLDRDRLLEKGCGQLSVAFHCYDDALLHPPEETVKSNGQPYTIFTPFYKRASQLTVSKPKTSQTANYYVKPIKLAKTSAIYKKILPARLKQASGGRSEGLQILEKLKQYRHYSTLRDYPARAGTTHLSAHLKFTTVSVREVYHAIVNMLGTDSDLLRSLFWRDFFTSIAFHFPHVFKGAFREKFANLSWSYDEKAFARWREGTTGFPIVDAGMRELNQTGFMHNRVRMITASFLVKDLHINWQWGERYFAQQLIDYDPAVNNGNWQWAASTGCDAQPYFRIFNPWNQQKKFDPDGEYIKMWIPELGSSRYPEPMLDHSTAAKHALAMYKAM